MRIVYTAGVFDLIHGGHIEHLWLSKHIGDLLVVGVVTDSGARAYKGKWPAENQQLRLRNIRDLGIAQVVVYQSGTDPSANLERFRPAVMTHGSDWDRLLEGHETLERLGIEWVLTPRREDGPKSSELVKIVTYTPIEGFDADNPSHMEVLAKALRTLQERGI